MIPFYWAIRTPTSDDISISRNHIFDWFLGPTLSKLELVFLNSNIYICLASLDEKINDEKNAKLGDKKFHSVCLFFLGIKCCMIDTKFFKEEFGCP